MISTRKLCQRVVRQRLHQILKRKIHRKAFSKEIEKGESLWRMQNCDRNTISSPWIHLVLTISGWFIEEFVQNFLIFQMRLFIGRRTNVFTKLLLVYSHLTARNHRIAFQIVWTWHQTIRELTLHRNIYPFWKYLGELIRLLIGLHPLLIVFRNVWS